MASIFQNGVWSCGFDFFPTGALNSSNIPGVFSGGLGSNISANSTFARLGIGKAIQCSGATGFNESLGVNLTTVITGFGFMVAALPSSGVTGLLAFTDASTGTEQFGLAYNSSGQLQFYKVNVLNNISQPSSPFGTLSTSGLIVPGVYCYIEVLATIGSSGGQAILNVNGVQQINFTGNTQTTANAWTSQLQWGEGATTGSNPFHTFDDLYALDTTGAAPLNAFLGPGRIQTDGPNGDSITPGLNTWAFTTPLGTDYQNFAQIPASSSNFNSSQTVGARASCIFPTIQNTSRIFFFNTWDSDELDAAGSRTMGVVYRNKGTDQAGPTISPAAGSYAYHNTVSTVDPNSGTMWANQPVVNSNGMEIGPEVLS